MKRSADDLNTDLFRKLGDPRQAEKAWGDIYTLFWKCLIDYVLENFSDIDDQDAEEMAAEVLYWLWKKRKRVSRYEKPRYWLFVAMSNYAKDHIKTGVRWRREPLEEHEYITDDSLETEDESKQEKLQAIEDAIGRLPTETLKAVRMRFQDGMDYQEIATALGKSVRTVTLQVHDGLKKIREWLGVKNPSGMKSRKKKDRDDD